MFGANIKKMKSQCDVAGLLRLASGSRRSRGEALEAIESLGPSAEEGLMAALEGNSTDEAGTAAFLLGLLSDDGSSGARNALLDYINSPGACDDVCLCVLSALHGLKGDDVVDALVGFLEGPRSLLTAVRESRVFQEQLNQPKNHFEALRAGDSDPRYMQLKLALKTLTRCADPKAASVFRRALEWREPTAKAFEDQEDRAGLYNFPLRSFRRSDRQIRTLAARGLGRVRDPDSVPLLIAVLSDKDEDTVPDGGDCTSTG